jgi:hypothetical protein
MPAGLLSFELLRFSALFIEPAPSNREAVYTGSIKTRPE